MKRSEMLDDILNLLIEFKEENKSLEYTSESLLDLVESRGMLPSHDESDHLFSYDCFHGGHYDRVVFEWEPEDE